MDLLLLGDQMSSDFLSGMSVLRGLDRFYAVSIELVSNRGSLWLHILISRT